MSTFVVAGCAGLVADAWATSRARVPPSHTAVDQVAAPASFTLGHVLAEVATAPFFALAAVVSAHHLIALHRDDPADQRR